MKQIIGGGKVRNWGGGFCLEHCITQLMVVVLAVVAVLVRQLAVEPCFFFLGRFLMKIPYAYPGILLSLSERKIVYILNCSLVNFHDWRQNEPCVDVCLKIQKGNKPSEYYNRLSYIYIYKRHIRLARSFSINAVSG